MSPWDEKSVLRGSPLYMAPEMVCRRQYDSRVDLWSVGVILYGEYFVFTFSSLLNEEYPQHELHTASDNLVLVMLLHYK